MSSQIGIVGLGVMGGNLARNMLRHGIRVAGFDTDAARVRAFAGGTGEGAARVAVDSVDGLLDALERPRRVLCMVPAGPPVDRAIASLAPGLSAGDILIDAGNSWFLDTERRGRTLADQGVLYLGMGVSGGESGALWGPAIMPGGPRSGYDALEPVLVAIAARAPDEEPCVAYMGPGGAGHYVKMVHNGVEYGDMQLIAEVFDLLSRGIGMPAREIGDLFADWNATELRSYLVEITAQVLRRVDGETGTPLVDLVVDEAEQKGTGKWTSQNALEVGTPVPTITAAVESRHLSSLREERLAASRVLRGPGLGRVDEPQRLVAEVREALYAAKITSYAQGFGLLRAASANYGYHLRFADIARVWRAGCIIRAAVLEEIASAFGRRPELGNLLLDGVLGEAVTSRQGAWRRVVQQGIELGIPMLAMASSLAYFDAYRSERLPSRLTQAQRDCFGAHTYRRIDRAGDFHTAW